MREVARDAARAAARNGLGTVSGGAKGVDRLAMDAALESEAVAVGVLADSLVRTVRDPDVRRAITDGRLCLCSPYQPSAPFNVANAMGRNKLIYALSQATFVVASDLESGGTWGGATEALRRAIAPVLVWTGDGAGPGNARLVERGATPVDSIDELFPLPTHRDRGRTASTRRSSSRSRCDVAKQKQCKVCGETKMPGWDVCPACGHPYDDEPERRRPPAPCS